MPFRPCSNFKEASAGTPITACELIKERWSTDVAPDMWARAAARASTAPFSSISFSADCLKWLMAVGGTESKSLPLEYRGHVCQEKGHTNSTLRFNTTTYAGDPQDRHDRKAFALHTGNPASTSPIPYGPPSPQGVTEPGIPKHLGVCSPPKQAK